MLFRCMGTYRGSFVATFHRRRYGRWYRFTRHSHWWLTHLYQISCWPRCAGFSHALERCQERGTSWQVRPKKL